jgi:nicotinamide-nucleotide amidase
MMMTENIEDEIVALARTVGEKLARRAMLCATAESCTGGLIGHLITENPGSSVYFAGAAVTYSYAAKERVLGVDPATLLREGAVSAAVAQQMAEGALRLFAADVAVSVTGIAGPGGGLPNKPTGTVYLHCCARDGYARDAHHIWEANRSGNKLLSAQAALAMVLEYLEEKE